jgi:hypothetical protein
MNASRLTKRQEGQQDNHVQTDHQSTPFRSRNLSQEQRCCDSQTSCSKATKYSCKEHEPINARRENLHQDTSGPDTDGELVRPETSNAIIEEYGGKRAESSSQHTEGRDVRLAICKSGRPSYPIRLAQVEVIDK